MLVSVLWLWLSLGAGSVPAGPVAADAALPPDAGVPAPAAPAPVCEPGEAPFQGRWCVQAEGPFSDVQDVKATPQATCVLRGDSSVWCWGELEDLRLPAPHVAGAPVAVGVGPVEALWSGRTEVCARRADQTVVCWGGSLRDNRTCSRKGCQLRELPTLRGASALGIAGMRVCGVVEGRLQCAGWR